MTITADFSGGEKTVTTEPLYQWDTGHKLALSGLPATSTDIQVHFANAAMAQAIVKATATENSLPTCDIPNEFLQFGSAAKARAWVFYKASSTEGYTVRTVLIPVTPRKRPNDYVSPEDPDSKGIVERAMELLENYQSDLDSKLDDSDGSVKTANLGSGAVTEAKLAQAVKDIINAKEVKSNKKTTLTGNESSNDYYPTTKAVADALNTKASLSTAFTIDSTTTTVVYSADNPKKIYTNAYVNGKNAFVLTTANNYFQIALCCDGTEYTRELTAGGSTTYKPWVLVNNENTGNKKDSITNANKTSTDFYPSIKAVVDYLVANYEALSNKLSSEAGIDEDSTDTEYPSAKAVYDFGADILDEVTDDLGRKENLSNKKTTITGYETSNQFYPTTKAVYEYVASSGQNVEAIPHSVKLAMDTLFSKAAYADDDAASSYATFHAWAMSNVTENPLTVQPNITYDYVSGKIAASENRSATSLISIDDTSITHTVSAAVNGVEVDILLRVFDQNGLAFYSSGLAKSQTIPAKDYKCFGVVLVQVVTSNDVVTVTVDGVQKQASYGTLEEYSNTVPVDIQVGGIDGTTGEIIENSARLITGFIDIVSGLFNESASTAQLLLTAPSGVYVKVFEYSDSGFLQNSSVGMLDSSQAKGNPASACTKFRVLFKKSDNSNFTSADIESLTLNNYDIVTYEFTEVN